MVWIVSLRGLQGAGPRPTMEKRWGAGCLMFPGGGAEGETCPTAQQTLSTFLKFYLIFFNIILIMYMSLCLWRKEVDICMTVLNLNF